MLTKIKSQRIDWQIKYISDCFNSPIQCVVYPSLSLEIYSVFFQNKNYIDIVKVDDNKITIDICSRFEKFQQNIRSEIINTIGSDVDITFDQLPAISNNYVERQSYRTIIDLYKWISKT